MDTGESWQSRPVMKQWMEQVRAASYYTPDDVEQLRGVLGLTKSQMADFLRLEVRPVLGGESVKYRNRRLGSGDYPPAAVTELSSTEKPFDVPPSVQPKRVTPKKGKSSRKTGGGGRSFRLDADGVHYGAVHVPISDIHRLEYSYARPNLVGVYRREHAPLNPWFSDSAEALSAFRQISARVSNKGPTWVSGGDGGYITLAPERLRLPDNAFGRFVNGYMALPDVLKLFVIPAILIVVLAFVLFGAPAKYDPSSDKYDLRTNLENGQQKMIEGNAGSMTDAERRAVESQMEWQSEQNKK